MVDCLSVRAVLLLGTAFCLPGIAGATEPTLPQGGEFRAGTGQIALQPGRIAVTQSSARAVIDWRSFSVGAGGAVQINNGSGATLNRITGTAPSRIAGTLSGTGSVYVVNPQGVVVAPGGEVRTGGTFVASTRPADNGRFMADGTLAMSGTSTGRVVNTGRIEAGGQVVMVGEAVRNRGTIAATGSALLAATDGIVLQPEGDTARVVLSGGRGDVRNTGAIGAAEVALRAAGGNVFALAGNTGGRVQATGTVVRNGRILLEAAGDVTATGTVSADGTAGGEVRIAAGGQARIAGKVSADGASGSGGRVIATGRTVRLDDKAQLSASGATAGGVVLLGGDVGGGRVPAARRAPEPLPTATRTIIGTGARVAADGVTGPGGAVVVWSETHTDFAGAITARGRTAGGFVEISSHTLLDLTGRIDLRASAGTPGRLLLDPADVAITEGPALPGQSVIRPGLIAGQLAFGDVTITTNGSGGAGDITVSAGILWSANTTLTLSAARDIAVNAAITAAGPGNLTLRSDSEGTGVGTVRFGPAGLARMNGGTATIRYNPVSYDAPVDFEGNVQAAGILAAQMLVSTPAQLDAIRTNPGGTYALGRDIDLAGTSLVPLPGFSGSLDGLGHSISNLSITRTGDNDVGLFSTIAPRGVVQNLTLENAAVEARRASILLGLIDLGGNRVGLLAGENYGTLRHVSASGSVSGHAHVGGLVGYNRAHAVLDLFGRYTGTIDTTTVRATVTATETAGGVAGTNAGDITRAAFSGAVKGATAGGIAAANPGSIAGAVSSATVMGPAPGTPGDQGGIAARGTGRISAAFWDLTLGPTGSAGGSGLDSTALGAALPQGLLPADWLGSDGAAPRLRGTFPAQYQALSGRAPAGSTISVLAGAAMHTLAAGADGTWTLSIPSTTTIVAALLDSPAAGTTMVAGASGAVAGVDLQPGVLRLDSRTPDAATLSSLMNARTVALGGRTLADLMPAAGTTLGATSLAVAVAGSMAVDQPVASGGIVALQARGAITQSAPIAAGVLTLQAGGAVTLRDPANAISRLAGIAGSLDLATAGPLGIVADGVVAGLRTTGPIRLEPAGTLTLEAPVQAAGTGDAVVLVAPRLNATAAGTLAVTGGGRWVAYLPDIDAGPGRLGDSRPYYGAAAGAPVPSGGNRLAYARGRTLVVGVEDRTTTYDGTLPAMATVVQGLVGDDLAADAVSGQPQVLGLSARAGTHPLTVRQGSLASDYGYGITTRDGTLTIQPRPLTWAVADATSTYGTTAIPGAATLTGVVAGDAVAATVQVSSPAGVVTLAPRTPAGSYTQSVAALTGAAAANYDIAGSGHLPGTLTIQPRPLTWAVADATSTYGTTAIPGAVTLTGVAAGDAVAATVQVSSPAGVVTLAPRTPAGSYTQSVAALTGAAAANYVLASAGNTQGLLRIRPDPRALVLPPFTLVPPGTAPSPAAPPTSTPEATLAPTRVADEPPQAAAGTTSSGPDRSPPGTSPAVTPSRQAVVAPAPSTGTPAAGTAPQAPSVATASPDAPAATESRLAATMPMAVAGPESSASAVTAPPLASPTPPGDTGPQAPGTPAADAATGSLSAFSGAITAAAATTTAAGVRRAEAEAAIGTQMAQRLAAGASPAEAMAGAQATAVQLVAASTRTGRPTAAQALGDALANPDAAGAPAGTSVALSAALAAGLAPAEAMRQALQAQAEATAMRQAADVPIPAHTALASALGSAALPPGEAGSAAARAYAAALAAGHDPEAAQRAATQAATTLAAMEATATLPPTPARRDALALAAGDARALIPAGEATDIRISVATILSTVLAHGLAMEDARQAAERAAGTARGQLQAGTVGQTAHDARLARLARGEAAGNADEDAPLAAQLEAARVPVADPSLADLAQGRRPMAPARPPLSEADDPPDGSHPALLHRMARGALRPADLVLHGGSDHPELFARTTLAALAAGAPIAAALAQGRDAVASWRRDAALPATPAPPPPLGLAEGRAAPPDRPQTKDDH